MRRPRPSRTRAFPGWLWPQRVDDRGPGRPDEPALHAGQRPEPPPGRFISRGAVCDSFWSEQFLGLRRLFEGDLPAAHEARKASEADLESLTVLPSFPGHPTGALLALRSGSRPQRQRAALMSLDRTGTLDGVVRQVDLSPLYAPLRAQQPLQNIEGAFVNVDHLCLLQRGHATEPINAVIRFDWSAIQAWLRGAGSAPAPLSSTPFDLGTLDGVPLCFTDGATLPDGAWVFCAAAEQTSDNYADGPRRGSAIGIVGADDRLRLLMPLSKPCKTEGIAAIVEHGRLDLLLVTDADDRESPGLLLGASLPYQQP